MTIACSGAGKPCIAALHQDDNTVKHSGVNIFKGCPVSMYALCLLSKMRHKTLQMKIFSHFCGKMWL